MRYRHAAALLVAAPLFAVAHAQSVPPRLSDKELWQLNSDFSEPNGYFRSDNFLSNETGFQWVIPTLKERIQPGGVYLGVGPEQNFTYIVALKPKIAFIFDIRRGNMMAHLMYKALIETSDNRADFLSKLFSRPRPAGLDTASTPQQLFDAYIAATPDTALFRRNLADIKSYLAKTHGFVMNDSDSKLMDYTYSAFFGGGPELTYNYSPNRPTYTYGTFGGGRGNRGFGMPTYATLQESTDSAGKSWAYLATESNFRWLKDFESRNLLVPLVGDFAGPKAIRSVGTWLKDHHAVVSAFYLSNVEQYLWQQDDIAKRFYANVATLPIDSTSTFIRSIGGGFRGYASSPTFPQARLGGRLPSVTSGMAELVRAFNEGRLQSYGDVIALSK